MTIPAMTSKKILNKTYRLQMSGVDTLPVPTQVVNLQPFWDRAQQEFVGMAMGTFILGAPRLAVCDVPIPILVNVAEPLPTSTNSVLADIRPEVQQDRRSPMGNIAVSPTAHIMHSAQVIGEWYSCTIRDFTRKYGHPFSPHRFLLARSLLVYTAGGN